MQFFHGTTKTAEQSILASSIKPSEFSINDYLIMHKDKQIDNFNHVIDRILNPIFRKNKDNIQIIFKENDAFRDKVEQKLAEILLARKLNKVAKSENILKVDKSNEMSGLQVVKNGVWKNEQAKKSFRELEEKNIDTSVSIGFTEDLQAGKVEIEVAITDPEVSRIIRVTVRGLFTISEGLSEEEIKIYLAQNGTAILYPYVRSIISMISTLDSQNAIVLPTINTVQK